MNGAPLARGTAAYCSGQTSQPASPRLAGLTFVSSVPHRDGTRNTGSRPMSCLPARLGLPPLSPRLRAAGGLLAAALLLALLAPILAAGLQDLSTAPAPVAAMPAPRDQHEGSRTRCAGCGVVTAIRAIEGGPAALPAYEFTVRFRDGSVRTTIAVDRASWQVGDRIIVVGGEPAR
jgi:hypothetical protein